MDWIGNHNLAAARPVGFAGALGTRAALLWLHLRLARPPNAALVFVATCMAAGLAGAADHLSPLVLLVAASNACLAAAATALNDWHDVETDAVNRPDRPIPSGAVPRTRALLISGLPLVLGLGLAALAGPPFAWQAAGVVAASAAYDLRLKAVPFAGHELAAGLWAYPLWCWVAVAEPSGSMYVVVCVGFVVMGLGAELISTALDAPGDRASGIRTVATLWGAPQASRIGTGIIGASLLLAWLPIAAGDAGWAYGATVGLSTVAGIIVFAPCLRDAQSLRSRHRVIVLARAITVLMVLALAWDLLGGHRLLLP